MSSHQQNKIKIIAAFFAVYFIWGTTYLAIKYAVENIPPYLMMGMRSLSAGAVLYLSGRFRGDANVNRSQFLPVILIGILFFLIGHGGLAWAEKTVPSGIASLLITTEPIIIALFEPLFTGAGTVSKRTMVGMFIGLAGVSILVLPQGFNFENANITGTLVIIFCACSWSAGAIYSRIAKLPASPFITSGSQLLSGGIMLILVSSLSGELSGFSLVQVTARSWAALGYLILFGSIVAFSAYTWLLKKISATRISTHTFVNPVIAVIVGWAFGGEAITIGLLVATVLILISVYLVLFRKTGIV